MGSRGEAPRLYCLVFYRQFEGEVHGRKEGDDVVIVDVKELYENLSKKTILALSHIQLEHAQHVHKNLFVAKTDDDVYIDVQGLRGFLRQHQQHQQPALDYAGFIHRNIRPVRTTGCKWRDEHYPDDVYPPYAGGMFYILSQRAMEGALAGIRAAKQAGAHILGE